MLDLDEYWTKLALPRGLARIAPRRFEGLRPVVANAPPPKTLARFVEHGPTSSLSRANQKNAGTRPTFYLIGTP